MNSTKSPSILIVEDEVIIAETLKRMLLEMNCNVSKIANNLDEFEFAIEEGKTDLAFLDINLTHEHDGIQLAEKCHEQSIPFVFITSYSDKETIRRAMALKPLAYINKPFTELDLFKVCEMMKGRTKESTLSLKIKDGHDTLHIKFDDINWLKAENVYTIIQCETKKYLIRSSLKDMLDQLPKDQFVKTHRSYAVNINKVTRISAEYVEVDQDQVPLSRTQKVVLNEIMG